MLNRSVIAKNLTMFLLLIEETTPEAVALQELVRLNYERNVKGVKGGK